MIVELEKQLKDAEADREARRKDKEEEKVISFATFVNCCNAYLVPATTFPFFTT